MDAPTLLLLKEMKTRSLDPVTPTAPIDWKGYHAVSYTQPRANETKANLVCRLLPDKKYYTVLPCQGSLLVGCIL